MSPSETKARSRISTVKKAELSSQVPASTPVTIASRKNRLALNRGSHLKNPFASFRLPTTTVKSETLHRYLEALPFLGISIFLSGCLLYMFTTVSPSVVANWLLFQSYLPILVLFLAGSYFFARFVVLNSGIALGLSTWLTWLLFLKFQSFVLTIPLVLISGVACLAIPSIWAVLFRR